MRLIVLMGVIHWMVMRACSLGGEIASDDYRIVIVGVENDLSADGNTIQYGFTLRNEGITKATRLEI